MAVILHSQETIDRYTAAGFWGDRTLLDIFDDSAKAHPDRPAVMDPPDRPNLTGMEPETVTYAELSQAVNAIATALLRAGLQKDDVVMVQLPNTWELHHHNVILLETGAQQSGSNGVHGLAELRVGHGLRLHAREVRPIRRVHDGGAIGVGFRTVIEDIQEGAIAPEACSRVAVNRLLRMQNHCHAPFCLRLPGSMSPGSMPPGGMSEACRLVPCPILILLPEFGLLELARGGLGNLVGEYHSFRHPPAGELLRQHLLQLLLQRGGAGRGLSGGTGRGLSGGAGRQDHHGQRPLLPLGVGHSDHGRLGNGIVSDEGVLQRLGADPLTPRLDQVLGPIGYADVAVLVYGHHVAGAEPAVVGPLTASLWLVEIIAGHPGSTHMQLSK